MLLAGADERDLTKLAEYQAIGGYERAREGAGDDARRPDRGAAGRERCAAAAAPASRRAARRRSIAARAPKPTYLVVNADESEPGAFKDREIMTRVPHRLIEGCLIAAHAIESKDVFIYIRGEYLTEYEILAGARSTRRARPASSATSTIVVHRGAGAYICGEETALLESLEGKRGQPRPRPPFPPMPGPLRVADADQQRRDDRDGAADPRARAPTEYAKIGAAELAGHGDLLDLRQRRAAGNYELELGTSLRELIYDARRRDRRTAGS